MYARLLPNVLEVENADHGLYVAGPLTGPIAVLGRMVAAMQEFLDAINWPGGAAGVPPGDRAG
jgi:hypothetical protein